MRIAVLSDIHGFSLALEQVLVDIESRGIDRIVVAGDLFQGGPDPAGVLSLLRESGASCVYGNTDRDLLAAAGAGSDDAWARAQIGEGGLAYLRSLPFEIRIPHPGGGDASTDLLVVHANPTDVDQHLSPNASDREIRELLNGEVARTIAFGHLHIAYTRTVDVTTLVDVSAVGNPRDGDLRPRYVEFSEEPEGWAFQWHYLTYPLAETREQMEMSGMPKWRKAFDRLVAARYDRPV